jgi:hypothetical protein
MKTKTIFFVVVAVALAVAWKLTYGSVRKGELH